MSDSIFGLSDQALTLCEQRAVTISSNIVNSATPHYKAKDIDFHKILQESSSQFNSQLFVNDFRHLSGNNSASSPKALYRVPAKTSLDGNTVDQELERKNFLQNALNYQVNLTFIKNTTNQMMKAIKGE